jgi:hypothetical protein
LIFEAERNRRKRLFRYPFLTSRLGKATESTTLTEPQPSGRGNGTKAAG